MPNSSEEVDLGVGLRAGKHREKIHGLESSGGWYAKCQTVLPDPWS